MILYLNYKKMFSNVCKHYLIIYGCIKFTFKKVGRMLINYFQVLPVSVRDTFPPNWIQLYLAWHVLVYPRFLGEFYYHGTMILPCIK